MVPILSSRTSMLRTGVFQMIRLSSSLNRHLWTLYKVKHDCRHLHTEAETIQPSTLTCSHAPLWPLTCLLCLHPVCGTVSIRRSKDLKNLFIGVYKNLQSTASWTLFAPSTSDIYVFSEFQTSLSNPRTPWTQWRSSRSAPMPPASQLTACVLHLEILATCFLKSLRKALKHPVYWSGSMQVRCQSQAGLDSSLYTCLYGVLELHIGKAGKACKRLSSLLDP